ncbi:MAG: DUF4386 domain-containing protein [Chloroflexi bacterium]|nr:DUF4386 domain-containing protein [Chloroflexota bacterium]MBN9396942.1 DUF4386 domain-containing protein [Candidatus Melainabacteria bacterium]OJV92941.1 MAG: hypothetical protein BGO39_03215 [Chloroflexi bacterium 54-19]
MNTNRKIAITVGVLYIIGTLAGVASWIVTGSILEGQDYLNKVAANETQFIVGAILVLLMGLSLALVPVVLFPILKKLNEVVAIGYVVFRGALETFATIASVIAWLLLIILSKEYVKAGAPDIAYFKTSGTVILEGTDSISAILAIVFSLGALMLYYVLYQSKLIPRWISIWGFLAAVLYLGAGIYNLFGPELTIGMLPMLPQEMVMAVWLIVKGFNPSAIASEPAISNPKEVQMSAFR